MKVKFLVLVMALVLALAGCGERKEVHCDRCGQAMKVDAGSNVEESWIVYCDECYTELFGEEGLVS